MKTDIVVISGEGHSMEAVLGQVDAVAAYKGLSRKGALHLRLLAEETMAMVRAITGEFNGEFWIEDRNGVCELHLKAETTTDAYEREQLLSASTTGRNEAARGFMGKLRAFFQSASENPEFASGFSYGTTQMYGSYEWSMKDYREELRKCRGQNVEGSQEAWDELEKSVVSRVADDVRVSILGKTVEMTIAKAVS